MKKIIVKFSTILAISFGVVLGVKAYNKTSSPQLLVSNIEAINKQGDSKRGGISVLCDHDYSCPCLVRCPQCNALIEKINDYGAGTLIGPCPVCGHISDR